MRKKEILNQEVEKINKKYGEEIVITSKKLSEKDNAPTEKSGTDNNCYTDFSSIGEKSITQEDEKVNQNLSVFENLSKINVNDKVEVKNKMRYLSWSYAWSEAKRRYPLLNSKVYETETGCNYFTDGRTCWVKVSVTIEGLEHVEYYPVIDYKNTSIPLAKVSSFDVNKAIQRGLTKSIARHGLGLYIYAGEDLPEEQEEVKEEKQNKLNIEILSELNNEIEKYMFDAAKIEKGILTKYKVKRICELTEIQAKQAINTLKNFKKKEEKENV